METLTAVSQKDTVINMYESFGRGDIPAILACMTDDITWDASQNPVLQERIVYKGIKNVPQFFKAVADTMDITVFEPQNFFERGNILFVNGLFEFTMKKDNSKWRMDWTMRWQFRGDKVEQFNEYFQTPEKI